MGENRLYLIPLILHAWTTLAQDDQCYWRSNDAIRPVDYPGWFACNNTQLRPDGDQLCCLQGAQCSDDALCRTASDTGGYNYFVGGCTNANYADPVCRKECTGDAQTWITWVNGAWACCGDNGLDSCSTPTDETFNAEGPYSFSAVPSGPTPTSSSAASTSPTTSTSSVPRLTSTSSAATSSASTGASSGNSGGLSTGAAAGIGVGVGVVALAAIAAIIFFCWRRRKSTNDHHHQAQQGGAVSENRWQQSPGGHEQHRSMPPQYQQSPSQHGGYYNPSHSDVYAKRAPDVPINEQPKPITQLQPQELPSGPQFSELSHSESVTRK